MQTRCIVKGEAQKSPLFWRFSGGLWFSQDHLFSRNSTRKPLYLIKSPIFTNAPCKTACLYNAPSMHTLERCCLTHPLSTTIYHPRWVNEVVGWSCCCQLVLTELLAVNCLLLSCLSLPDFCSVAFAAAAAVVEWLLLSCLLSVDCCWVVCCQLVIAVELPVVNWLLSSWLLLSCLLSTDYLYVPVVDWLSLSYSVILVDWLSLSWLLSIVVSELLLSTVFSELSVVNSCLWTWVHRGRSDTVAKANPNSDAPRRFASEFIPENLKEKMQI